MFPPLKYCKPVEQETWVTISFLVRWTDDIELLGLLPIVGRRRYVGRAAKQRTSLFKHGDGSEKS